MPLDAAAARRFYDHIGAAQDTQRFYEDRATQRLAELAGFNEAHAVFELGCGTGRYAVGLLREVLPGDARYVAAEISPTMVRLARKRLAAWAPRTDVRLLEPPAVELPGDDGSFDRFVANYVFDLLEPSAAEALIAEAGRLLAPRGRIALVSLTPGPAGVSKLVSRVWGVVAARWPTFVGGCRPLELAPLLSSSEWRILAREIVVSWGVPSEVLVAERSTSQAA